MAQSMSKFDLPAGFVYLNEVDPTIIESVRYATNENFLGEIVPGYTAHKIICSKKAAIQLKLVNEYLQKAYGYKLVVYDAYRPQQSVDAFVKWQHNNNEIMKAQYYPTLNKKDLFHLGYIAEKSSHSKGSTFDLTIIETNKKVHPIKLTQRLLKNDEAILFLDDNTVDMGSSFDLFHPVSHHDTPLISKEQNDKRNVLRNAMKRFSFKEYQEEWWHYTLVNEPFSQPYNFIIK